MKKQVINVLTSVSAILIATSNAAAWAQTSESTTPGTTCALENTESPDQVWINEITSMLQRGDFDGALKAVDLRIAADPNCADAYCFRALINYSKGNVSLPQIAHDLDAAIALRPNYVNALMGRAIVAEQMREFTVAQEALRTILQIEPKNEEVIQKLISVHEQINDVSALIDDYTYWLTFAPDNAFALSDRAYYYSKQGKKDLAIADLKAAYKIFKEQGNEEYASRVQEYIASLEAPDTTG